VIFLRFSAVCFDGATSINVLSINSRGCNSWACCWSDAGTCTYSQISSKMRFTERRTDSTLLVNTELEIKLWIDLRFGCSGSSLGWLSEVDSVVAGWGIKIGSSVQETNSLKSRGYLTMIWDTSVKQENIRRLCDAWSYLVENSYDITDKRLSYNELKSRDSITRLARLLTLIS